MSAPGTTLRARLGDGSVGMSVPALGAAKGRQA